MDEKRFRELQEKLSHTDLYDNGGHEVEAFWQGVEYGIALMVFDTPRAVEVLSKKQSK